MTRYTLNLVLIALVALFAATAVSLSAESRARFLNSANAEKLKLPFSEAVRAGDLLYLSGQIGNVPGEPAPVPGGIVAESRQALTNIEQVLQRNGSTLDEVIKCTIFLVDMAEWSKFNAVYREFFKPPYPTRSAVGVKELALGARVEVECLAYSPS
jgi:reactive intermediate/imine deaminase